jgi:hypothetical protein
VMMNSVPRYHCSNSKKGREERGREERMRARHINSTFIDIDIDIGNFAALFTWVVLDSVHEKSQVRNPRRKAHLFATRKCMA